MDAANICSDNVLNRLIIFDWKDWTFDFSSFVYHAITVEEVRANSSW